MFGFRNCSIFIVASLLFLDFGFAFNIPRSPGKITFPKPKVHLGPLQRGEVARVQFPFTVSGSEPVTLKGFYADCACVIDIQVGKYTYAPGENGLVEVSFDSMQFLGKVSRKLIVLTDSASKDTHNLYLNADVVESVVVEPPLVILQESAPFLIRLKNLSLDFDGDLKLNYDHNLISVREAKGHGEVVLTVTLQKPFQRYTGIEIAHVGPKGRSLVIPVFFHADRG